MFTRQQKCDRSQSFSTFPEILKEEYYTSFLQQSSQFPGCEDQALPDVRNSIPLPHELQLGTNRTSGWSGICLNLDKETI